MDLESGSKIPADLRLIESKNLKPGKLSDVFEL